MRAAWGLALLLAACRTPAVAEPVVPPSGIAIALYRDGDCELGVVDERRWVTIERGEFSVAPIDPAASLAELLVEPLGDPAVQVGECTREGLALRCAASGAGRTLVRVVYATSALHYEARHAIDVALPGHALLTTWLAVATPAWEARADVTVFDGVPGGDRAPRELARGTLALDGKTAELVVRPRLLAARIVRIFDGAVVRPGVPPTDPTWGHDSTTAVQVALELPDVPIAAGPVHVHVALRGEAARDVDAAIATGTRRVPLGVDRALHATRRRVEGFGGGDALVDQVAVTLANTGAVARDVWIEEPLRPARVRSIIRTWPEPAHVIGDVVRVVVPVPPGGRAAAELGVAYEF